MLGSLLKNSRLAQNMGQQALCAGICSVSYLSKIETGAARPDKEIYRLLFNRLGISYTEDAALLKYFAQLQERWFENCLYINREDAKLEEELLTLASGLTFSPMAADAFLLHTFLSQNPAALENTTLPTDGLTARQLVLFCLIKAQNATNNGDYAASIRYLEQAASDRFPFVYLHLSGLYAERAHFQEALSLAQKAYHMYAEGGHIHCMLMLAQILSVCYYNIFDLENAYKWDDTIHRLAELLNDASAQFFACYNKGASLIEHKSYREANLYLQRAHALLDRAEIDASFNLYQKMGINAAFLEDSALLALCYSRLEGAEESEEKRATLRLLNIMRENKGFLTAKEYCPALEEICRIVSSINPKGKHFFFQYLLYDAYKETRQYKKALQLAEQAKFPKNFV